MGDEYTLHITEDALLYNEETDTLSVFVYKDIECIGKIILTRKGAEFLLECFGGEDGK